MKICQVKIRNFRGIKELDWALPDKSLFCLIGKGDSSKSTILDAIRYTFFPQWNLVLSDSDFYLGQTNRPLCIEIVLGELPPELRSLDRYGHYLFGWDKNSLQLIDEPGDGLEDVLVVRFNAADDLEPHWNLLDHQMKEGIPFKQNDRIKANVSLIGNYTDRHLTWGKGSVLSQMSEIENINLLLAQVTRSAKDSMNLAREDSLRTFDTTAQKAEAIAKTLGVPVTDNYKAQLDVDGIHLNQGGLSLHDGDIPLRQLGLGSRRLLICGLQKESLAQSHITLFDEVEVGLEPHRISRLLKFIHTDQSGQYFLTTHSPTVLRELTVNDLYIVHNDQGSIQILSAADKGFNELNLQGNLRSSADAFLAKKIIICEGQTEVGFVRGLDDYWLALDLPSFAYQGVTILNAGGNSKIKDLANGLKSLNYDIAVIVDGDDLKQFSQKDAEDLRNIGILVVMWSEKCALEERIFNDLPWQYVCKSVKLALLELGDSVLANISSQLNRATNPNIDEWQDSTELRQSIGKAAKAKNTAWFKDISRGEKWATELIPAFGCAEIQDTELMIGITRLKEWVNND